MNKKEIKQIEEAKELIEQASAIIDELKCTRESYAEERSEKWADSDAGQEYVDQTERPEGLYESIVELSEQFDEFIS
jgi:hypothetical protein